MGSGKTEKRLVLSDITNTIYYATVKKDKEFDGFFECVGEKVDVTDNALRIVYAWFINKASESDDKCFAIRFGKKNCWLRLDLSDVD